MQPGHIFRDVSWVPPGFLLGSSWVPLRHPPPGDPSGVDQALACVRVALSHPQLSPPDPQPSWGNRSGRWPSWRPFAYWSLWCPACCRLCRGTGLRTFWIRWSFRWCIPNNFYWKVIFGLTSKTIATRIMKLIIYLPAIYTHSWHWYVNKNRLYTHYIRRCI